MKMENVQDSKGCYNIAIRGIIIAKARTNQEICISPEREFFLYDWYWPMKYTCAIDPSNNNLIFHEFAKTVLKSGNSGIDSNVYHIFRKVYELFYGIVQKYRKVSTICVKKMVK